jgi:hypothetical protein
LTTVATEPGPAFTLAFVDVAGFAGADGGCKAFPWLKASLLAARRPTATKTKLKTDATYRRA